MEQEQQKPIIREYSTLPPTPLHLQQAIFLIALGEKEIEDDDDAEIYLGRLIAKEQQVIRKIQRLKEKKKVYCERLKKEEKTEQQQQQQRKKKGKEKEKAISSRLSASAAYTSLASPPHPLSPPQPPLGSSRDPSSPSSYLIISKGRRPLTEYNSEYPSTAAAVSHNDPYRNSGSVTAFHQQLPFPIKRPAEELAPSSVGQLNKQYSSSSLTFFDSINNHGTPNNTHNNRGVNGMNHGYGGTTTMSSSSTASSSAMFSGIANRFGGRDDAYSHYYYNSGDGNNRDYHRYSNQYFDRQPLPQSSVYSSRGPIGGIQPPSRRNIPKSRIPPPSSSSNWFLPDRNRGRF
ncbi:4403_t:CDS:2 [Ambispora gerdemannii]|uniref:4403_t:CDS:1 n=1 Tax=Ambispora gerdemannii TaxID=144530 RepID=A0A9N9AET0_9GLOM|nr:4403_t:CDS:2 [Ambispora gerdemannii]